MRSIKGYLDEWRIQEYLLITFFISWLSWGILILLTGFGAIKFQSIIGYILFGIGGFGPTISAIMCLEGKLSLRKIWDFIVSHRKGTIGYLLLFSVLSIASVWLSSMETNPAMPLYALPVVFLVCTLFGGGNEELGWRGTLQPLMEKVMSKKIKNRTLSFIVATLCVGLIWALWHLPLWFVVGSTQQGINYGLFAINCILLSFWLAALYRKTHSVLFCMILHGLTNVLMGYFAIKINAVFIIGYIVITVLAIMLSVFNKNNSVTKTQEAS